MGEGSRDVNSMCPSSGGGGRGFRSGGRGDIGGDPACAFRYYGRGLIKCRLGVVILKASWEEGGNFRKCGRKGQFRGVRFRFMCRWVLGKSGGEENARVSKVWRSNWSRKDLRFRESGEGDEDKRNRGRLFGSS